METVIVSGKDKSNMKLLLELAKKLGIKSKSLSRQEIEDWLLAKRIEEGLKSESVSKESVVKILQK
jgi:cobalamin biosynthesis protein CbiG